MGDCCSSGFVVKYNILFQDFSFFQLLFEFPAFSRFSAPCLPAGYTSVHIIWTGNFLEHNANTLIILTKHSATQSIIENWKISSNFLFDTLLSP